MNGRFTRTPRQSLTATWSVHRGKRESSPGSCYSSDCRGLCFQRCPRGFTWSSQISLPFPPCNHSYINNSKYFSDCSASFSSSCLFSASLLPKQQTELMWVVVGGRGRQQWAAHFLCFQCFSLAFPWVESKGWIIAGSIMMQTEQTSLFKQWQLYEALQSQPKPWCYHQSCLSSQSLQVTAAGSRSFDSQILYVISFGPSL